MHYLRLITGPETEPVSVEQAKAHLRIEHALDDAYITTLITVARAHLEKQTWSGFIAQTWEQWYRRFPSCDDYLVLRKRDPLSILSLKYMDDDGVLQTFAPEKYELDAQNARVVLAHTESWPSARDRWNAVQVQFTVGYGATAESVPAPIRQAVLLLISQMYEHRTPEITGTIVSKVSFAVEALIAPYRRRRF